MTMDPADVVVTDLFKAFGDQPVLRGLDLTVPAGTLTAILGTSGSGKTTLLRIVAGYERPDRGSVAVGGTVLDDEQVHVRPESRRIGYVSQEGSLFPHLNVEANIGFGLSRRERRGPQVGELLDAVGLNGLGGRFPHQLSGGQQQRVALARSLAVGSRIVLLDEPFNTLDANLRASVRADVHAILSEAAATAILVTHDQDEALLMADLIAVIRGGTIAQLASPGEIYDNPVDADLAQFVGDANLVDGVARGDLVDTPLGQFTLRGAPNAPRQGRVSVLIRPEQLEVSRDPGGPGAPGRALSADFHGSDTVVRIAPQGDGLPPQLVARVLGNLTLAPGAAVTVRVAGTVCAWSAPPDGGGAPAAADAPAPAVAAEPDPAPS
jgi:iron(III) transport system ATP-binding protein